MTSKKPSAKAKQREAFETNWDSFFGNDSSHVANAGSFAREEARIAEARHNRETQFEYKSCGSKGRYGSEREAQEVAAYQQAQTGTKISVYHCDFCNGWHITSHPWD